MAKANPFAFINAINFTKEDLMTGSANDELAEAGYVPFITNRSLSYFPDTVMLANEVNMRPDLTNRMQFHFYLHSVRKRKRFGKWHKVAKSEDVATVSLYFGYSLRRAAEALALLTDADLAQMRDVLSGGGRKP
jgi:hypothetical protein